MKLHHRKFGPPPVAKGPPTLVLLHGYGADELDLVPLGAELDPSLPIVSLQGPLSLGGGMRAWYHLQQTRTGFQVDPDEVREGSALVAEAVAELVAERGKVVLAGFSQGGGMAAREALAHPEGVLGLVTLSGVPPRLDEAHRAPAVALRGLPVFAAHGLADQLLDIGLGHLLRDELQSAGCEVSFHKYEMGHTIIPAELDDLRSWLARLKR